LVGGAGVGPAPHSLDRQDGPRRYGFDGLVASVIAYSRVARAGQAANRVRLGLTDSRYAPGYARGAQSGTSDTDDSRNHAVSA
jgi:hypothetical protein